MSHHNQELFSNYYLDEQLPKHKVWATATRADAAYQEIKDLYQKKKSILTSSAKESQIEAEWIRPIFDILSYNYIIQPAAPIFDVTKEPDYAFYETATEKDDAYKLQGKKDLFDKAIAVGDAKRWDLNLLTLSPNKQLDLYLRITDTTWGILTNGRLWRIYNLHSSYRLDVYYETLMSVS